MLISLNWLTQHLDLSDYSPQEIGDMLTFSGVEVEKLELKGPSSPLVVVAQIMSSEAHPNADRLKVCRVNIGKPMRIQIVCGASNYKVGDKVPCALLGAQLAPDFVIKVGKLRGVDSHGMLCAASEIGHEDSEDGLMILPEDAPLGMSLIDYLGTEAVFQVEITPNRPDLLSHRGIAKELSALTKKKRILTPVELLKTTSFTTLCVEEPKACPYYTATKISGLTVSPSPSWLQKKLAGVGIRAINNVVDITNYVLHELGHPLHAFDAAKVSGSIKVRNAKAGEKFKALDGEIYELVKNDLLVSDEKDTPLALAGIIGGEDSGVTESTTDIILESAWFEPSGIRATSRRLALTTDSSYRFERGVDPKGTLQASSLAAILIASLAEGSLKGATQTFGSFPKGSTSVEFSSKSLDYLTEGAIPWSEAQQILTRLGFREITPNAWTIPSARRDITRPVDLAEEVIRLFGLENIPSKMRTSLVPRSDIDDVYDSEIALKHELVGLGFYEAQTIKLIADEQITDSLSSRPIDEESLIKVLLPLSSDQTTMRPSLIPGLLSTAARNARQGVKTIRFFEIGTCFQYTDEAPNTAQETPHLGIIIGGNERPESWLEKSPEAVGFFDIKATIEALFRSVSIQLRESEQEDFYLYHEIFADEEKVGKLAMLTPARTRELDFAQPLFVAEIHLEKLLTFRENRQLVDALPSFPSSSRDLALELSTSQSAEEVTKTIQSIDMSLLVDFQCIDVFTDPSGEKIDADRKSMTYRFLYRASDRTLKSKEVDQAHQTLVESLVKKLDATIR